MKAHVSSPRAFTILELLTVIAIIAILIGLLSSVLSKVKEKAKQASAKNDLLLIVSAVNTFYADYGVYPIARPANGIGAEVTFASDNSDLVYALCARPQGANAADAINPRQVVYLDVSNVKNALSPRSGICNGNWYDPWGPQSGKPESGIYHVRIDGSYSNTVTDPYPSRDSGDGSGGNWSPSPSSGSAAPPATLPLGVIAWSLAGTGVQTYDLQDQILSWK